MARVLHRIGLFTARHHWIVLAAWLAIAAVVIGSVRTFGSNTSNNLDLPGTDSQRATDLLAARFPPQQNGSNPLVFKTKSGKVTDAANKQAITAAYDRVRKLPHVYSAVDPYSQEGQAQISKDGRIAFISVLLDVGGSELTDEIAQSVLDAGEPGQKAGMEVAVGGSVGSELSEPATESSEIVGLVAAMIILLFTFGALVAAGLPIVSAVIGLLVGLSLIGLLGHAVTVPSIAPTLATMIGLGVGIDYALFLVSRYRVYRRNGMDVHAGVAMAVATSGTAIVFAGTTVVIALITLLVAGIPLVTSLGYTSAFAVVTAVLAAITLLPAMLGLVGKHLDSVRMPAFMRAKPKPEDRGLWGWWARAVTNRPWFALLGAGAILVPLIIPFGSLNLGQEDIGATPKSTTERQAYDLMTEGFGVGYNGPLLVATELGTPAKPSQEYENQVSEANKLQKQLEQEQKQGQTSKQQLTAQANKLQRQQAALEQQQKGLEAQQGELERQQASLEQQATDLQRQQRALQQTRAGIQEEQVHLSEEISATGKQARQIVAEGAKVTKQLSSVVRKLARNRADQRAVQARIKRAKSPSQKAKLEAKLRALEKEETALDERLDALVKHEQALRVQYDQILAESKKLRQQEVGLANRAVQLATDAVKLGQQAVGVVQQKQSLQQQAADLQVEAADLQVQAANLQTQGANLNTQQEELQNQQQQAQSQQQQAEQLKQEITNELTKAGGDDRGTDPRLVNLQNALTATDGVQVVSPPRINKAGNAATYSVIATTAPSAPATADLVKTLRTYVIPQATHGTDVEAFVGGQTASYVDLAAGISNRLLLVIFTVILLSIVVLLAAFRSLVVALQAAVANALSVAAAFGVLTAVFQWGWGLSLIGLDVPNGSVPIASYVPLMMFAVLFGLSMDYQVFLISQIEHHRADHMDDRTAISGGLAAGARVIVAAALIMISVFGSFILDGDPTVKQFGVGLSVGVALAAMTVLLLAPALLVLIGRGSWWLPGWMNRLLPRIDIEGQGVTPAADGVGDVVEAPPEPA